VRQDAADNDVFFLLGSEANVVVNEACEAHPLVFKALAQLVSQRLRQRSAFVQPPNPQPVLFIGSSTEALPIANELQAGFKHDKFDAIIWKDGVFGPGGVAFGRALNAVEGHTRSGSRDDFLLLLDNSRRRQGARSGGSEARE
jgi:predicted nucleotide-binding protein